MSEKEKSFSENAKDFLGAWKNDHAEKNKEIMERKKQRDADAEKENQEMKALAQEIKKDLQGTAKDLLETFEREFQGFATALKEGSATVAQKLELEKRFGQLEFFLKKAGTAGVAKFEQMSKSFQQKIASFDEDSKTEKDSIKSLANKGLDKEIESYKEETDSNFEKIKGLFDDK
jgi:predicted phage tail protein